MEINQNIKNGNLSLQVGDTEEAKTLAENEVKNLEGSVTNMNSWQVRPGVLGYNMTIRIPAGNLETLLENLGKIGSRMSEGFNTQDITSQYQDTQARIANLETRRDRLRQLRRPPAGRPRRGRREARGRAEEGRVLPGWQARDEGRDREPARERRPLAHQPAPHRAAGPRQQPHHDARRPAARDA